MGYGGWAPYVPVAVRRAKAARKVDALRKKGAKIESVEVEGRKIAHTFWGQAWCTHLEGFSDYANRLPRGRTYVRNGSVCHLGVEPGRVQALVCGSELYEVRVEIGRLASAQWAGVKERCAGQIGSLLDLLQGRLSKGVMAVVTDRAQGLFPLPGEMRFSCSCPDWASMCKHVAAVLYGVGARLDRSPELLFRLRGVDHGELVAVGADAVAAATGRGGRRRRVSEGDLAGVFGIELAGELGTQAATAPEAPAEPEKLETPAKGRAPAEPSGAPPRGRRKGRPPTPPPVEPRGRRVPSKPTARPAPPAGPTIRVSRAPAPPAPVVRSKGTAGRTPGGVAPTAAPGAIARAPETGVAVARLRAALGLTRAELARLLGVSPASVGNWERAPGKLHLQDRTAEALQQAAGLTKKQAKARLARRGNAR
ncbi:MAG: helix-turn-helix domain-containing protein [Thermodesulfobacteriota bacterium]